MCNFIIRSFFTPYRRSITLVLATRSYSFRIQTRQLSLDWPRDIPLSYRLPLAILSRLSRQYIASALRHASRRKREVKVGGRLGHRCRRLYQRLSPESLSLLHHTRKVLKSKPYCPNFEGDNLWSNPPHDISI